MKKFILITGTFLLSLGLAFSLFFLFHQHNQNNVYVYAYLYQEGVLIEKIPLWQVANEYTLSLINHHGEENIILIDHNKIGILSANCPDQICVHRGVLSYTKIPITCLPHEVLIVFEESLNTDFDMITY